MKGNRKIGQGPQREVPETPGEGTTEGGKTERNPGGAAADGPRPDAGKGRGWFPGVWRLLRLCGALLVSAALVGSLYGGVYFLRHSRSFAIREVRISPTTHVSTATLRELADVEPGENLFRVNLLRVQTALRAEPWLKSVRVRRELPATVTIDVVEYQARALVAFSGLYLVDEEGVVFKRATPAEVAGLPVITGIGREIYVGERADAQGLIREALAAVAVYGASGGDTHRPPIGEAHVDRFAGTVLYTAHGMSIHLGSGEPAELKSRLRRFDAVLAALRQTGEHPAIVYLDNRAHPDHITVGLQELLP